MTPETLALRELIDAGGDAFQVLLDRYGASSPLRKRSGTVSRDPAQRIISEAVNRLPAEITGAHPEIAWLQIRGSGDILGHQYGVDIDIVDDVVETHLPPLAEAHCETTSPPTDVAPTGRRRDRHCPQPGPWCVPREHRDGAFAGPLDAGGDDPLHCETAFPESAGSVSAAA